MARRGGGIGVIVVLALTLAGCGSKPVIGVLLPTTGSASVYGESIDSGIRLALTDVRQGTLRDETLPADLEVVWADTGSDPQRAATELRRLVKERKAQLVIGGATSGEARALLPVLADLKAVCLSPSASQPSLTREGDGLFFRIYPSDELEGSTAGKFLYDKIKKPSVLLYTGNTEYTRGVEPEFRNQYERLGGKVVGRVELSASGWQAESTSSLERLRPSAVYVIGYADEIVGVLQHLKVAGYGGAVVTTSAFDNSAVVQRAGALAEMVMFPLPPFDRTSDKEPVASFVQRYMRTYQRAPDVQAAHGYDAMRLALRAMSLARPVETTELKQVLHFEISGFPGVTGPISFNDYGDVQHYPTMAIIVDGQVVNYQRYVTDIIRGAATSMLEPTAPPS